MSSMWDATGTLQPPAKRTGKWRCITDDYGEQAWYKICSGECRRWLTTDQYHRKDYYCTSCRNDYRKRRYRQMMTNRARHAEYLEDRRIEYYLKTDGAVATRVPSRGRTRYKVPPQRELLPIEPIAKWIEDKLEEYPSKAALANVCGVHERSITTLKNREFLTADYDVVDKILRMEGTTDLSDLYPQAA